MKDPCKHCTLRKKLLADIKHLQTALEEAHLRPKNLPSMILAKKELKMK